MIKNDYNRLYQLDLLDGARLSEGEGFAVIHRCLQLPDKVIPFDKAQRGQHSDCWPHFFIHDKNFMCAIRDPLKYIKRFRGHPGVYTPDSSIVLNAPPYLQKQAIGQSRLFGYVAQHCGKATLPTVSWGDKPTYSFSFESLEPEGYYAVSNIGCVRGDPLKTAFEFQSRLSHGYSCFRTLGDYGHISTMPDGSEIIFRRTSTSDGSPVVELTIKNLERVKSQKIHFVERSRDATIRL